MKFKTNGNLDGAILTNYSLSDIEKYLVKDFPNSTTRQRNFKALKALVQQLDTTYVSRIWLDGSFCTTKENPNDIDCLIFLKPNRKTPDYRDKLQDLTIEYIDKYLIPEIPNTEHTSSSYLQQRRQEKYWMGQFGFDRNREHKAIIELTEEQLNENQHTNHL